MTKRALVTGGFGFIGAAVVRLLVDRAYQVHVLDNGTRGGSSRLADLRDRVKIFRADIRQADAVIEAARGCEVVHHLAYINGTKYFYEKPDLVLDVAVRGMVNVIDACKKNGVRELVLTSSSEVYQTPARVPAGEEVPLVVPDLHNPRYSYGGGKVISELMAVHIAGKDMERVIIVRPHNVYGPAMGWDHVIPELTARIYGATIARGISHAEIPLYGGGSQSRAFVFIEDFVDGVRHAMDRGRHLNVYNVGTTDELRIIDIANLIADRLEVNVRFVSVPAPAGETARRVPDIGKLRALGYTPRVDFQTGLARTLDWYIAHIEEAPDAASSAE